MSVPLPAGTNFHWGISRVQISIRVFPSSSKNICTLELHYYYGMEGVSESPRPLFTSIYDGCDIASGVKVANLYFKSEGC